MKKLMTNHLAITLAVAILLTGCASVKYSAVRPPRAREIERRVLLALKLIPGIVAMQDEKQFAKMDEIMSKAAIAVATIEKLEEGVTVSELNQFAEKLIVNSSLEKDYKLYLLLVKDIIIFEVFPSVEGGFRIEGVYLSFLKGAIIAAQSGVERARLLNAGSTDSA